MAELPPLHVVTDDSVIARTDFVERAAEVMAAGGSGVALHLRAPRASGRRLYDLAILLAGMANASGSRLIVNDRLDVALASDADGVQLGSRSLAIHHARLIAGPGMLIGASVHSLGEARAAREAGADFVIAGNVYETASHPGRAGVGIGLIEEIASIPIPVVAIGGVTPERAGEARRAGAAGVAAIRGVWDAPDVADAVQRYLEPWKQ
jgi:thiamine-phosphate diphosphorylase